ncbi:hypothetical protein QQ045_031435 [Rhodiola kirilowii]
MIECLWFDLIQTERHAPLKRSEVVNVYVQFLSMESVAVRSSSLFYSIGAESNLSTKSPTASRIATLRWTGRFGNLSARAIIRHRRLGIQAVSGESTLAASHAATTFLASPVLEKAAAEKEDYDQFAVELENASPLEIMDKALEKFGNDISIAFSGAEDVALIEYARLTRRPFRVFSLDTGRLNPETYQFFAAVEKHYGIHIEYMFPDAVEVQGLVRNKGLFSFYEDGHQECCSVRKVRPLRRALKGLRAWITGQRKDQSPCTRSEVPVVQVDPVFEGIAGGLVKWNTVANVDGKDIWNFLRAMDVPVNPLHAKGYISIGCEPCTRPVLPGQHEREGRWWWEDAKAKECGLHKGNINEGELNGSQYVHVNGTTPDADLFNSPSIHKLTRAGIEKNLANLDMRQDSWLVVLYAPLVQILSGNGRTIRRTG